MEGARYPKLLDHRPGSQLAMGKGIVGEDLGSSFGAMKTMVNLDSDDELDLLPRSSQPGGATSRPPIPEKREKRDTDEVIKTLKFNKNKKPDDTPTSKENTRRVAENTQRVTAHKDAILLARKNAAASSSTRPLRDNAAGRNRSPDSRAVARHDEEKARPAPDAKPPRPKPRPRVPPTPATKRTSSVMSISDSPSVKGKKPENARSPVADAKPPRPKPRPRVLPTPQAKPALKRTSSVVSIPDSPNVKGKKPEIAGFPGLSPLADSKGKGREMDASEKKKGRLIAGFGNREVDRKGKGKQETTQEYPQEGLSPFSSPVKSLSSFLPSPLGTPNHKEKLSNNGFPAPSPLRPEKSARPRRKERPREEFPMNTQDFAGISSPVKRRSLGSDSDDERDRKRYKSQPVVVSREDYEEEDSELLFISPGTDPKTLCPYCDTPLPAQPTPLLTRLLEQTFNKSYRDARPSNPLGRKAPMGVFVTVCQRHRFESETLPEAEARGWPKFIDWAGLTGRVLAMKAALADIIADPGDPIVYGNDDGEGEEQPKVGSQSGKKGPRMRCLFWKDLVKELKTKGSKGVKGVQGQFANFEKTQPGYYGELGSVIIHQTLYDMFPLTDINPTLVDPLTPNEFVQRILVPEVGMRLVIEDMELDVEGRTDKKRAVAVLRDSASYGVAMFPEDGGDWAGVSGKNRVDDEAMGVADLMVMERARKRRKELEIEEREEDEAWQAQQEREEAEKQRAKAEVAKEKRRARREAREKEAEAEPVVVDLTTRPRPRPVPKSKIKATVAADMGSGMDTASGMDTDSSSDPRPSRNHSDRDMVAISSSESSPDVEAVATPRPRSLRPKKVESVAQTSDADDSDFPLEVAAAATDRSKRAKAKPKPKPKSSKPTTESTEPEVEGDAGARISPRPRSPSASLTSGKRSTRGRSVVDLCSSSEGGSGVDNANPKPRKADSRLAPRRKPRRSIEQLPASSDEDDAQATPRATVGYGVASSSNFRPLDAARRRAPAVKGVSKPMPSSPDRWSYSMTVEVDIASDGSHSWLLDDVSQKRAEIIQP
ncbi:RTC4-like domain-containing protein [Mycena metata]|uniref:Restriction of telomere capping protein 4 n=1 Tax=Mycena metata TaxID=1033252 RepID=A0AAD7ISA1_9AGAR|nr:RTC4-like domain-containing protein [Mycena metata]